MQLGLDISQHQLEWSEVLRRTRFGEEAGFDSAWLFDHFQPLYGDPLGPCMEAWTLLGALAARTERIRLGVLVTGVTYRHPSVLAAEALTAEHVSGGRLEFGIGASWFQAEHEQLGISYPGPRERVERLDEAVQIIRLLMTTDNTSFTGRYFSVANATLRPRPKQQPHPPFWIGGDGERRMLPLVGRQADVWHGDGSVEELVRKSRIVDEHARQAGRDPAAIARSTWLSISEDWETVTRTAEALRQAGFSYLIVSWPGEGWARIEEFVSRVMPRLR